MLRWLYHVLRWSLGGIFLYAGSLKLLAPGTFATLIGAYGLMPEPLLLPMAVSLSFLEIAAGLGMLLDIRGSLSLVAGLLIFFMAALLYGIRMGLDIDCGCFGDSDPEAGAFHSLRSSLYRDAWMFAGVALMCAWRRWRTA